MTAVEASRLARNGRDWHTLIEFCGLVGTVIVDEDGNRLLLGMKGTMSELELWLFRQRSQEALKQKARRGSLFLGVAAGYVQTGRERIERDHQRVQDALNLVFSKFAELQSVRQVHVWLREKGIVLPAKSHDREERCIVWKLPIYNTVHNIHGTSCSRSSMRLHHVGRVRTQSARHIFAPVARGWVDR